MISVFLLTAMLYSSNAFGEIELTHDGSISADDAMRIESGSTWYAIMSDGEVKQTKIKKVPIEDPDASPSYEISSSIKGAQFYIRGITIKAKKLASGVKEGQLSLGSYLTLSIPDAYFFSSGTYAPNDTRSLITNYKLLFRYKGKISNVHSIEDTVMPHSVAWSGDLNGDGIPDFLFSFDPWEKNSPDSLYFSEVDPKTGEVTFKNVGWLPYQGC